MFKQFARKMSIQFKPVYSTKEYVDLYINNSKDKFEMQNKVLFSSVGLLFATVGWSIMHTDKRFEQVDKRFEHIENEIKDIKNILIEEFKKNKKE
jgi:hypothetical protein